MATRTWKGALLVAGEPGTGKTRWIREEAGLARATLFRWNARVDRSLREGREILHQQVRSKDRLFVWIEGADDLTQEAQAFLRRILETAAPNVTCALEVRELWKLSPPILSRCSVVTMRSDSSYRESRHQTMAAHLGLLPQPTPFQQIPAWTEILELRKKGEDPYRILQALIQQRGLRKSEIQNCMKAIGAGSSPWIQLSKLLFELRSTECVRA